MKRRMLSRNTLFLAAVAAGLTATYFLSSCSSGSSTGPGGGGGTREFASPTLGPGAKYTHPFNTAKVIRYYCRFHGGPNGVGMSGIVTVGVAGTPNLHSASIISNVDLPDLTIEVGDTITWTNNTSMNHTVESDN